MGLFNFFFILSLCLASSVESSSKRANSLQHEGQLRCETNEYNVFDYGATGDGKTDDSKAFLATWKAACPKHSSRHHKQGSGNSLVYVPLGHTFLVYPVMFKGPCGKNVTIKVDGTILAPQDPSVWDNFNRIHWLQFKNVNGFTLQGMGCIDGQGQGWWAKSCKTNPKTPCQDGPTAISVGSSKNVVVENINILNSQQMHLAFQKSTNILVNKINISAPETSPNTDGIHVSRSSNVVIQNSVIGTGDDCISVQSLSYFVTVKNVTCGPGHGISVGGLGKHKTSAEVTDLLVEDVVFKNTTNGVRIKTWQGSSGVAARFTYRNIRMENVQNPILIDQYYCDSAPSGSCHNYTSNVEVSDMIYENITGTSSSEVAVKFSCSETVACKNITMFKIDLDQTSCQPAQSFCCNAWGISESSEAPPCCLK